MIFAGDTIKFRGITYKVLKVNPKNFRIEQLDGRQVGVTFNLPRDAPGIEKVESATYTETVTQFDRERDLFAPFITGAVVRLSDESYRPSKWNYKPGQLFVVLKHNFERVNIVKLGGETGKDRGRYWRMSPSHLEVVPVPES